MDRHVHSICGHIYNMAIGESREDTKPAIDFLSLPSDWACPVCYAGKDQSGKV